MAVVRWVATFDLDGRPPKGYLSFAPYGSRQVADQVPVVNGQASTILAAGRYHVTERIEGRPAATYLVDVPAGPGPLDLAQYVVPDDGGAVVPIGRAEFDALVADVDSLVLSGRPSLLYTRTAPAATWTIDHTLGRYPEVTVLDDADRLLFGADVQHTLGRVTIEWPAPATGKAVLREGTP